MGFSRQEYWRGLPSPSPGDLPDPGSEPQSPALQADSLPIELWGKLQKFKTRLLNGKFLKSVLLFKIKSDSCLPRGGKKKKISRDTFWIYLGYNLSEIHLEEAQVSCKGSAFGFQIKLDWVKGRDESHQKPANRWNLTK